MAANDPLIVRAISGCGATGVTTSERSLYLNYNGGNVYIGKAETHADTYLFGLLRPGENNTYDLGTTSYKWKNLYITNINPDNAELHIGA